jgi:hypothetical protein
VGSHVTLVGDYDPNTGEFTGIGGNQRRREQQFGAGRFQFYRAPAGVATAARQGPDRITGGVPFLSPGMPGMPAAQALDTAAIDRAPSQRVDVNGTGKLSVDVKAPSGTKVAAEGDGLFKETQVKRQEQMVEAEE